MAKKTYVSPGIMLLQAGDPGGSFGGQYSPDKDTSLGAKCYQFDVLTISTTTSSPRSGKPNGRDVTPCPIQGAGGTRQKVENKKKKTKIKQQT